MIPFWIIITTMKASKKLNRVPKTIKDLILFDFDLYHSDS